MYASWEPILCIGINMNLLQVFRDKLNKENRLTREMARSAYAAYILHPIFIVFGSFLVESLPFDPLIKFVILCHLAVASCFLVSDIIRREPLLKKIL